MKGQSKSPVIVTKIKALLFVQEQSWKLTLVPTLGERRRPARWVGPHSSSAETNYIPMLCPLIQLRHLSASQLHQDPKFISKAQTRPFFIYFFFNSNTSSMWAVTPVWASCGRLWVPTHQLRNTDACRPPCCLHSGGEATLTLWNKTKGKKDKKHSSQDRKVSDIMCTRWTNLRSH